ncbi:MAG: hypothetical protein PVH35_07740, partial [Syntrophobacterales bacterium]
LTQPAVGANAGMAVDFFSSRPHTSNENHWSIPFLVSIKDSGLRQVKPYTITLLLHQSITQLKYPFKA